MTATSEPLRISGIGELPALRAVVMDLLDMLGRDDVDTAVLATKLSYDQALTAKTLRLANSSFYGVPRRVTSVSDAITVLGMRTVRTVVTAAALIGSFDPPVCEGFDFDLFWRHAVATAVAAKLLAAELGADTEAAFTAGLLHDIGRLVLASSVPERYAQVLAHGDGRGTELRDCEEVLLGTDHAALGARIAAYWRFPQPIADAISDHHAPPAQGDALSLVHIVHVADDIAHAMEPGVCGGNAASAACEEAWLGMGLSPECWTRVLAETELQTQAICAAMLN
jgi:putative nucleotidyltransferase with HDIG domain